MNPRVRKMDFAFDDMPQYYCRGSVFKTHLLNAAHLIFPLVERFFIRSVRHYIDQIKGDAAFRQRVQGFCGQEVQHGLVHERFYAILEAQGYEIRSFLSLYERIAYKFTEHHTPPLVSYCRARTLYRRGR